jgi:hypothetical protein
MLPVSPGILVSLQITVCTITNYEKKKSNILKYAKWVKYSLTYDIFSNMQKTLFSTNSELNESSTFFTLIQLHRPSNDT